MAVETSIVIRTLNEAKHLESLLKGIHAQNYKDWEIIQGPLTVAPKSQGDTELVFSTSRLRNSLTVVH